MGQALRIVKDDAPSAVVVRSKAHNFVGRWTPEESSPAWWRGETFPRLRDALAYMDLRPGAVTPGSRPPEANPERRNYVRGYLRDTYGRKAHMVNTRCQVLMGMHNPTEQELLQVHSPADFVAIAERDPASCCTWCLKELRNRWAPPR